MSEKVPMASMHILGDKMHRKRAARACDQCRRRKSRCDGQMHCAACKTIGLQCSFGHQVKQSRGPAYVAHLEKKVRALQDELNRTPYGTGQIDESKEKPSEERSPAPTVSRPSSTSSGARPSVSSRSSNSSGFATKSAGFDPINHTDGVISAVETSPVYLETLTTEPRGKAFGTDVLRQLCNFCNQIASSPAFPQDSSMKLIHALDNPHAIDDDVLPGCASSPLMPDKTATMRIVEIAFSEAFQLWPFVDRSQVDRTLCRLYNTRSFGQEAGDKDELALVYAVLALGQRFDATSPAVSDTRRMQGLQYFEAAKDLVPLSDCDRSLAAIQTILCLSLYLKAASAQAKVHSYVAAASSAALRFGLHEDVPGFGRNESAIRRRVCAAIRAFDVYVSASLGVPNITTAECHDEDCYPPLSTGSNAELVASDAHMQLLRILSRVIENTYRSQTARKRVGMGANAIDQNSIKGASEELENWTQACPVLLQPAVHMTRTQLYLAYACDYAQLLLYSPFVHYLALPGIDPSSEAYGIGLKAVNAALHATQVAELLHSKIQFHEAYFLTIDVLVYAAVVLLVVESGSPDVTLVLEAMRAGRTARELLLVLSLQNETASQCWEALAKALAVRPSRISVNANSSMDGSAAVRKASLPETGLKRAKAPGPITLPEGWPSTLYTADSGVDFTADTARASFSSQCSAIPNAADTSLEFNYNATLGSL